MIDLELREKVARLMGAKVVERKWCYWDYEGSWCYIPEGCENMIPKDGVETDTERILPCVREDTTDFYYPVPPYETNIADAWLVVEFMREKKKRLRLYERERGDWFAEFAPTEIGQDYQLGCVAPTAPLAICMASVAAMENNHES